MIKFIRCFLTLAALCWSVAAFAQEPDSPQITGPEIIKHIKFLASDKLAGRKSGEEGNRIAAEYIASEFRRYGLKPAGENGSYFQPFTFVSSAKPGSSSSLRVTAPGSDHATLFRAGTEFQVLGFSDDTTVSGQIVFAGYGISDDSAHYDDYAGTDVKGKIVAVLRYSPDGNSTEGTFSKDTPFRVKAFTAREKGALGIIFITGPLDDSVGHVIPFSYDRGFGTSGIAAISMSWKAFDQILAPSHKTLQSLQRTINDAKKPASLELPGTTATLHTEVVKVYATTSNIAGYLEGYDASMKNNFIVVGAHMDHLGMGGEGSLKPDTVAIHPGADDNASGTAGVLEIAQYYSSRKTDLKRGMIFICFSGEELGLLGSDFYVNHPLFPLQNTTAMINMDMVGRLHDSVLVVEGMGTSPQWEALVKKENLDSLQLKLKPDGYGPSDHSSFYGKKVPVLFFFTNLHDDYHRPSDTWDKINYMGEQTVLKMVARIAYDIDTMAGGVQFTNVTQPSGMTGGDREGVKVSLGIVPDYASDTVGVKLSGARAGSPAEKAGLKANDIIVKFGGSDVKNIYDFMFLLGKFKPGDQVDIGIERDGSPMVLKAVLEARK